jgi:hypothetical protein
MEIKTFCQNGFMLNLDLNKEYYSVHLYKGTDILLNKFFNNKVDANKCFEDTQRKVLVYCNNWSNNKEAV